MIRAIIIDDEQHCIDRLERLLTRHCRESVAIMGTAGSIDEGVDLINRLRPDLVFLDIQIHDKTGFELLEQLEEIDFEVVFCTAYEQYTLQAIKFGALDYLLKPIDQDDLETTVERLVQIQQKTQRNRSRDMFEMTQHNLERSDSADKRIAIPTLTGYTIIEVRDILRCMSDVNYTKIFMADLSRHMVARTLKDFEDLLAPYGFIRLHNSHLVNVRYIRKYHKGKGGYVILDDKTEIEVSVRRKDALMQELEKIKL